MTDMWRMQSMTLFSFYVCLWLHLVKRCYAWLQENGGKPWFLYCTVKVIENSVHNQFIKSNDSLLALVSNSKSCMFLYFHLFYDYRL